MALILLVDDDDLVRLTLETALTRAGHEVVSAVNGVAALEKLQDVEVDVVVTDLIMPEKEGIETILEIRRSKAKLPIIAISGGGRGEAGDYLKLAGHLGADRVLNKPFAPAALLAAVEECLKPK